MQNYVNNHLQNHLNRRLILQSAAAGLTVLAAGCATSAKDGRPRVVVIGGGWGVWVQHALWQKVTKWR
ncbi:MAG: hypothetical protein V9E91_13380 [Burkholderiaceae bacterium]